MSEWKSLSHVWLFETPMDYTVHGIFQTRMLEWVAFSYSRGSSQSMDRTQVPCIAPGLYQLSHKVSPLLYSTTYKMEITVTAPRPHWVAEDLIQ